MKQPGKRRQVLVEHRYWLDEWKRKGKKKVKCLQCGNQLVYRAHFPSDFFIGGFSSTKCDAMITRDRGIYKKYFPNLVWVWKLFIINSLGSIMSWRSIFSCCNIRIYPPTKTPRAIAWAHSGRTLWDIRSRLQVPRRHASPSMGRTSCRVPGQRYLPCRGQGSLHGHCNLLQYPLWKTCETCKFQLKPTGLDYLAQWA